VPEHVCRAFRILPISFMNGQLTLATSDPHDRFAQNVAHALTNEDLRIVVAAPEEIDAAIDRVLDPLGEPVAVPATDFEADALEESKPSARLLGQLLIERKLITEEQLAEALSEQLRTPIIDLKGIEPDPRALEVIPRKLQRERRCVPLAVDSECLYVAITDPLDEEGRAALGAHTDLHIRSYLAMRSDLDDLLDRIESAERSRSSGLVVLLIGLALAVIAAFAFAPLGAAVALAVVSVLVCALVLLRRPSPGAGSARGSAPRAAR